MGVACPPVCVLTATHMPTGDPTTVGPILATVESRTSAWEHMAQKTLLPEAPTQTSPQIAMWGFPPSLSIWGLLKKKILPAR